MTEIISINAALACALSTLQDQPREVPQAPQGWADRAQAALDAGDPGEIEKVAREIASAHSQYRAEFDIKGWLFELRLALPRRIRS